MSHLSLGSTSSGVNTLQSTIGVAAAEDEVAAAASDDSDLCCGVQNYDPERVFYWLPISAQRLTHVLGMR